MCSSLWAQVASHTIYFEHDAYDLTGKETEQLKWLLDKAPDIIIDSVEAYCNPKGKTEYNDQLASKRLHEVIQILTRWQVGVGIQKVIGEKHAFANDEDDPEWRKVIVYYHIPMKSKEPLTLEESFKIQVKTGVFEPIPLRIEFENASAVLKNYSYPELEKLTQLLRDHPEVSIFLRGHVCCSDSYDISYARAQRVYVYLVEQKIDKRRIKYEGFSNKEPIVPEVNDEDRQRNRRVDVVFSLQE